MFNLWRTEKRVEERLQAYLEQVNASLESLRRVFPECLDGTRAQGMDLDNPVHKLESIADDIRRELEHELAAGKLLPQSRADLLAILEATDLVPNQAEDIVDLFAIQKIEVPTELWPEVETLLAKVLEACTVMGETLSVLFKDVQDVRAMSERVDRLESESDKMQRRLLRHVFELDLDLAHKLHLRDLVEAVAGLADRAQSVADMAHWMALKRRP